jgi:hypothetical protein
MIRPKPTKSRKTVAKTTAKAPRDVVGVALIPVPPRLQEATVGSGRSGIIVNEQNQQVATLHGLQGGRNRRRLLGIQRDGGGIDTGQHQATAQNLGYFTGLATAQIMQGVLDQPAVRRQRHRCVDQLSQVAEAAVPSLAKHQQTPPDNKGLGELDNPLHALWIVGKVQQHQGTVQLPTRQSAGVVGGQGAKRPQGLPHHIHSNALQQGHGGGRQRVVQIVASGGRQTQRYRGFWQQRHGGGCRRRLPPQLAPGGKGEAITRLGHNLCDTGLFRKPDHLQATGLPRWPTVVGGSDQRRTAGVQDQPAAVPNSLHDG